MNRVRRTPRQTAIWAVALVLAVVSFASCEPTSPPACPCTLFTAAQAPVTPDAGEATAAELGVRFTSDVAGFISGIRFYKSAANTGTHLGNLWSADGVLLASATFTSETTSGWQQVDFAQPVPIARGGTYLASYHTDSGHYAADPGFFATSYDHAPLHAPADGTAGNGVYRTGATGFPSSSFRAINYWVDPVLVTAATDTVAPTVVSKTPAADATSVAADTTVTARFSEPVDPASVTMTLADAQGAPVAGSTAYDAPSEAMTFTPAGPLADGTYHATVSGARDLAGNPLAAPVTWTFAVGSVQCPCSLWPPGTTPTNPDANGVAGAELGTRFSSDVAGYVTGVRFYKSAANTGTHTGHVWTSGGTLLGSVTFTGETASGWQTATFANPVAVTPGTSYVVSYYSPNGHYSADNGYFALQGVDRRPLHANRDCCGESNGVYRNGASGFPADSWQSTNYWVDVVFDTHATDTVAPTVRSTSPADHATGVPVGTPVSVTFSEPVRPDSVGLTLTSASGTPVAGSRSWNADTLTATFQPTQPLAVDGTYTAAVSGATDTAGNTMQGTVTWSFTPQGSTSLWGTPTPQTVDALANGPLELGTRFTTSSAGYVTGVRFYKSAANTGIHTGSLWTVAGKRVATATFTGETASGWQQVAFDQPVPISVGGQYVVSYHTDSGHYSADPGYFADGPSCNGALCAYQDGDGGGNGVFADGASTYPTHSYGSTNYWVDPVFTATAVDTAPPVVLTRGPDPNAAGVAPQTPITAGFSEPVVADSVNITVTGPGGAAVAGTVSYDAPSRVATFTPSTPLSSAAAYTVVVNGARDASGNTMTPSTQWSFSTARSVALTGTGGPILVVTASGGGFDAYLTEILRAEGLNLFATASLSALTPAMLSRYAVVVLAPAPVTATQHSMIGDWVSAGGHVVGIRPDPSLMDLFGLTQTGITLSDAYLRIDTSTSPGAGLSDQTLRFHGTADVDNLAGATAVANLYLNAGTDTTAPAVTVRSVGSGSAAAFTYDLSRSVVETRQGNPAWAGQHRLGTTPIRSTDLFTGTVTANSQTPWLDLDKVAVPQADIQQRLLANLITTTAASTLPIPRFWYLPHGEKAAVMLTGDDHGHGGTTGRFDQLAAESPPGCSVADWTCLRATSYVFPGTPISDAQAAQYTAQGFDIDLHTSTDCNDFTDESLNRDLTEQAAALAAQLPSIPAPSSNRTHCVVWSDWSGEPRAERAHGIGLDANYYWWPPQLAATHPGLFTGSGMPMRFADADGALIDVYQVPTQITDESGQPEPATIDTLLDNATGPLGYYAVIGVNAHTDDADSPTSDAVVASALRHGVPVVSARQLLTWLTARDRSAFGAPSWNGGTFTFSISADPDAVGLQAMVPANSAATPFSATSPGRVQSIRVNGTPVPVTVESIKGIDYAVFPAASGSYSVTYGGA